MGVVETAQGTKTAFRPMNFDLSDVESGAQIILGDVRRDRGPQFNVYRTILWTPTALKTMFERVKQDADRGSRVEFVDAYSFWLLLRLEAEYIGKNEFDRRL